MSPERNPGRLPLGSLRLAVLAGLVVTVLAWALVQFGVARFLLAEQYLAQEKALGAANAERALGVFTRELRRLEQAATDYSRWDETYNFVLGADNSFIKKNIFPEVFTNLKLDLIVYVAADGRLRVARSAGADSGADLRIPSEVAKLYATPDAGWLVAHRDNRTQLGFLSTPLGLLAYVAQPVHRNAWAHKIPARCGMRKHCGRVRSVYHRRSKMVLGQLTQDRVEQRQLCGVERVVDVVGDGQVSGQTIQNRC